MKLRSLSSLIVCGITLAACSASKPSGEPTRIPKGAAHAEPAPAPRAATPEIRREALQLGEELPREHFRVWLNKSFWLDRKIFVSYGVERSSRTRLAGSVLGYIGAVIRRHGEELVLERDMTQLSASSVLVPEVVLNAYPIVKERDDEILVDFAAARAPVGIATTDILSDETGSASATTLLDVLKDFRVGTESLTFFNLTTLRTSKPLFNEDDTSVEARTEQDPNLLALTIRTDWVLQRETPSFSPLAQNDSIFGFFLNSPLPTENGAGVSDLVNHIDTSKPFHWTLSANTPAEFVPAVTEGILAWNEALGSDVLTVSKAEGPVDSITDPTRSNLIWDDNRATSAAFANWRSNPYTGEIVQAEVYMPGHMWAEEGEFQFKLRELERLLRRRNAAQAIETPDDDSAPIAPMAGLRQDLNALAKKALTLDARVTTPARAVFFAPSPALATEKARSRAWCLRETENSIPLAARVKALQNLLETQDEIPATGASDLAEASTPVTAHAHDHMPYPAAGLTMDTFSKRIVRSVVMHEIGHTLGLRHNFLGSTQPESEDGVAAPRSGSIMDYNDLVIDGDFTRPGVIDRAVIGMVYRGEIPDVQPRFCSDEEASEGTPDCQPFDAFADPSLFRQIEEEANLLSGYHFAEIDSLDVGLQLLNRGLMSVVKQVEFMLYPTFQGTFQLSDPTFGERQRAAWAGLIESQNMRGTSWPEDIRQQYSELVVQAIAVSAKPTAKDSGVFELALQKLSEAALDATGIVALETRLEAIKGLKAFQDLHARAALSTLRTELEAAAPTDLLMNQENQEVLSAIRRLLDAGYFASEMPTNETN